MYMCKLKTSIRMHYRSGTGGRCSIGAGQTVCAHSPGGSTFLCEMTSLLPSWKYDVWSKIRQSMRIFVKNSAAKFECSPQSNVKWQSDRLFWEVEAQERQEQTKQRNEISSWSKIYNWHSDRLLKFNMKPPITIPKYLEKLGSSLHLTDSIMHQTIGLTAISHP